MRNCNSACSSGGQNRAGLKQTRGATQHREHLHANQQRLSCVLLAYDLGQSLMKLFSERFVDLSRLRPLIPRIIYQGYQSKDCAHCGNKKQCDPELGTMDARKRVHNHLRSSWRSVSLRLRSVAQLAPAYANVSVLSIPLRWSLFSKL